MVSLTGFYLRPVHGALAPVALVRGSPLLWSQCSLRPVAPGRHRDEVVAIAQEVGVCLLLFR